MRHLRIDLADNCNLRCIMCQGYNSLPKSRVKFLDFERFAARTEGQLTNWSYVQLGNQAEPLIHPHFGQFLKFVRAQSKATITVATNGKLLHRFADLINQAGNCSIVVSLDSINKTTHEYIREGSQFDRVVANLGLLDRARTEVVLSFTLMNANIDEYREMVRFGQDHGYRIAAFPMILREDQNIVPYNLLVESLWFNLNKLRNWLRDFYGKDYDKTVRGAATGITNTALDEFNCNAHREHLTIDGQGEAILCGQARLGNLADLSLSELWQSSTAAEFRRAVDRNRSPCLMCDYRERCLAPSMSRIENHFSVSIGNTLSAETKKAIGFDRAISDQEALELFIADLGDRIGVFDIKRSGGGYTAQRIPANGRKDGEPMLQADSRHELHEQMCRVAASPHHVVLLETYHSYNLVSYLRRFWAAPLLLGHLDLTRDADRAKPGILSADTLEELKGKCDATTLMPKTNRWRSAPGNLTASQPHLLETNFHGFNLVWYRGHVYALAVSLGPVDLPNVTPEQLFEWQKRRLCLLSLNRPLTPPAPSAEQAAWAPEVAKPNGPQVLARDLAANEETEAALSDHHLPRTTNRSERVKASLLAAIGPAIDDPQWAQNWAHLIEGFEARELLTLAHALSQPHAPSRETLEGMLVGLQKGRIQRQLDLSKKTVAVYLPTSAYREQFGTIPSLLRDRGCNVITIVGTVCGDKYERQPDVFYGGRCGRTEIVNQLDFVDLFLTPVLVSGLPAASRRVYFLHDIHDSPLGDQEMVRKISSLLRGFDYIFTPSKAVLELFRQVVPLAREPADKPLGLIPGGYPKLDRLAAYFQTHRQDSRTLIYAPTVFGYGFDEASSVLNFGEAIIGAVLKGVPDYRLIFRPHPHTVHTDTVRQLVAQFKDHPRFVFDGNASFYMDNYSQSALMISDISGTAFTYAFATERPVVFFSPNEAAVRRQYAQLQYLEDREKIGCVAQTVAELVGQIHLILGNLTAYQALVRSCREGTIFNVGCSEAYFVEQLESILSGKPRSDWTYVGGETQTSPVSQPVLLEAT